MRSYKFSSIQPLSYFVAFVVLLLMHQVASGLEPVKTSKGESTAKVEAGAPRHALDLNGATRAQLEALPGVGPATAEEIIQARPFRSVEELKNVKGIGESRFAELRNLVIVKKETSQERTAVPAKITNGIPSNRDQKAVAVTPAKGTKIDLNTANAETLESLPGVGPAIAASIIASRPFKSINEVAGVEGIGDVRFEQIRPFITVNNTAVESRAAGRPAEAATGTRGSGPVNQAANVKSEQGKVNINTATQQQLESLLDIGPVKAQAIIQNRPFKNIEDVMRVPGIKEVTFSEIKDRITVR